MCDRLWHGRGVGRNVRRVRSFMINTLVGIVVIEIHIVVNMYVGVARVCSCVVDVVLWLFQ